MNPFFSFIDNDFLMLTSKKTNLSFDDLLARIFKEFNLKNFDLVRLQQTHSNNIICTNVAGLYNAEKTTLYAAKEKKAPAAKMENLREVS